MKNIFFLILSGIILLKEVYSQCSSVTNVTAANCYSQSTNSSVCCMISSPGYSPKYQQCVSMSNSSFIGQNLYTVNGDAWYLNCSNAVPQYNIGGPCGNPNPKWGSDCWQFSNDSNSCCYYNIGNVTTGPPACQWYGSKTYGNVTRGPKYENLMSCKGGNMIMTFGTLLLAMLFF